MIAASAKKLVDPLDAFEARCDARAYLFAVGEFDLHTAVDVLQADAERDGLVDYLGQDCIQEILNAAFLPYLGRSRHDRHPDFARKPAQPNATSAAALRAQAGRFVSFAAKQIRNRSAASGHSAPRGRHRRSWSMRSWSRSEREALSRSGSPTTCNGYDDAMRVRGRRSTSASTSFFRKAFSNEPAAQLHRRSVARRDIDRAP